MPATMRPQAGSRAKTPPRVLCTATGSRGTDPPAAPESAGTRNTRRRPRDGSSSSGSTMAVPRTRNCCGVSAEVPEDAAAASVVPSGAGASSQAAVRERGCSSGSSSKWKAGSNSVVSNTRRKAVSTTSPPPVSYEDSVATATAPDSGRAAMRRGCSPPSGTVSMCSFWMLSTVPSVSVSGAARARPPGMPADEKPVMHSTAPALMLENSKDPPLLDTAVGRSPATSTCVWPAGAGGPASLSWDGEGVPSPPCRSRVMGREPTCTTLREVSAPVAASTTK
mmetsp:Transcript_14764/g.55645  ORF Transcript_14764/g.55645 Transcript_14764/m.55645 type:complete len:280 (+) Transcript_14764:1237-2076(+)